jgi:hypothetical protein
MAQLRNVSSGPYNVGNTPPIVVWTIVRGDTAAFRVYVTDDNLTALVIPDWTISMQIKRPVSASNAGYVTDVATTILTLTPEQAPDDSDGEFTVSLTAEQSALLETGDVFDIELRTAQDALVWTVAQGSMKVIEDVTN